MLFLECPTFLVTITNFLKNGLLWGVRVAVPIILIVLGMLDFAKGVMAQKEDEIKKGQKMFVKRLIAAVIFFLISTIVSIFMDIMSSLETFEDNLWISCWKGNVSVSNPFTPTIEEQCLKQYGKKDSKYEACVEEKNKKLLECKSNCDARYPSGGQELSNCMIKCNK